MKLIRLACSGGLVVALLAIAVWILRGPVGPLFGGRLLGEVVTEPVTDWSFTDAHAEIQVETRIGLLPYSVTTWCLSDEGRLYVPSRNGGEKRWVRAILAHPDARIRVGERVYPVRFERVSDEAESAPLRRLTLAKYLGIEAREVQPVAAPESGEMRAEMWLFRVESRDAG